jgi:hypothetical protein
MKRLFTLTAALTMILAMNAGSAEAQIARSYNTTVKSSTFNNDGPEVQGIRNIKQALQRPFSGARTKQARNRDNTYDRNNDGDANPVKRKATRQGANRKDLAAQQDRYN